MSSLQKSAMSARIARLPQLPPLPSNTPAPWASQGNHQPHLQDQLGELEDDEEEETDGLGSLPSSLGTPKPSRSSKRGPTKDLAAFAPISAADYFAQALSVAVPSSALDFRVYYSPPTSTKSPTTTTCLICHHGAGYSGLTFACFAKEVARISNGELGVLAFDARSHGKTSAIQQVALPSADAPLDSAGVDLSIETLTSDLNNLLQTVYPDPKNAPSLLLVGHSMGGTVIVRSCPTLLELNYRIAGVVVLDVVEGSAMEALPFMQKNLASRPDGFDSIEEAIEWHISNHTIRNPTSARISVPSLFVPNQDPREGPPYKWRAPLQLTAPFWSGWFTGLSELFLSSRSARLLVLAGTDRLDKTLMIGQMQGKFQMEVLPDVGHMLQEDDPTRLAELLVEFWKRNERVVPVAGLKFRKVGES